jgi:hypothetical protein
VLWGDVEGVVDRNEEKREEKRSVMMARVRNAVYESEGDGEGEGEEDEGKKRSKENEMK